MTNYEKLNNIAPEIMYSVHRICTMNWRLCGPYQRHNLILVYEGRGHFERDGEVYEAKKGDLIYYSPCLMRKAYTYKDDQMKCYAIDFQYTCPVFNEELKEWNLEHEEIPLKFGQRIEDDYLFHSIRKVMSELNKTWLSNQPNKQLKEKYYFMELMHYLIAFKTQAGINYHNVKKVDRVIDYICKHYYKKLSLNDLSSIVNISIPYLSSIFKEVTNKAPIEYLMDIRISKAKQLLDDGYTISECAQQTGFNDIYYFSKYFKKHEGIAPSMYVNRKVQEKLF
ncbi:AraC family transcriptional regulator [Vallitalea okinawensis]|uniref:AraC family transcriptional regulator n=1 Tax=Vallitalea okinawensis TaxID=2078660 RepID=UPI000CFD8F28|nr:AraC family transcriptional regulator [Vallitalea okinawensis]